jgi:PAS domain S-box-containing protein
MCLFTDPEIYRAVLESMQNGIYLVDRSGKIRFWNEGAEKITRYLRQDVLGHSCRDFFAQQEQEGKNLAALSLPCCVMADRQFVN